MQEYEYTLKVESIKPYIEYCEKNNYNKVSVTHQNRVVYASKHTDSIIARITTNEIDGIKRTVLDFKNVREGKDELKICSESLPIIVTDDNKDKIYSMLEVLDFYKDTDNIRTRYVYEKGGVIFEIDDYITPKRQVVAIEGIKEEVDKVYQKIKRM